MGVTPHVLFVDDDEVLLETWRRRLGRESFRCSFATGFDAALTLLESDPIDVVICDERFPRGSGWELLENIASHWPRIMRIMITGSASATSVVAGINRGNIYRLLLKPCPHEVLLETIASALETQRLKDRLWKALTYLERITLTLDRVAREHPVEYSQAVEEAARTSQTEDPVAVGAALDAGMADLERTLGGGTAAAPPGAAS